MSIPKTCRECRCFFRTNYVCHNERGKEAHCTKGYMAGHDMRDFSGTTRFEGCRLEKEQTFIQKVRYRVTIEGEYSVYDVLKEDLYQTPEEAHDNVIEYMYENFSELINDPSFKLELIDLHTEEE